MLEPKQSLLLDDQFSTVNSMQLDHWVIENGTSRVELDLLSELKTTQSKNKAQSELPSLPISLIEIHESQKRVPMQIKQEIESLDAELFKTLDKRSAKKGSETPKAESQRSPGENIQHKQLAEDEDFVLKKITVHSSKPDYQFGDKLLGSQGLKELPKTEGPISSQLFNIGKSSPLTRTPRLSQERGSALSKLQSTELPHSPGSTFTSVSRNILNEYSPSSQGTPERLGAEKPGTSLLGSPKGSNPQSPLLKYTNLRNNISTFENVQDNSSSRLATSSGRRDSYNPAQHSIFQQIAVAHLSNISPNYFCGGQQSPK